MSERKKTKQSSAGADEAVEPDRSRSNLFPLACPHCKKIVDVDFRQVRLPSDAKTWYVIAQQADGVHRTVGVFRSEKCAREVKQWKMNEDRWKPKARNSLRAMVRVAPDGFVIQNRKTIAKMLHIGVASTHLGNMERDVFGDVWKEVMKMLEDDTIDLEHIDDYVDKSVHMLVLPSAIWWSADAVEAVA